MAEAVPRENHDFVTMATYAADMDELSARGLGIIKVQRREIEDLKRTIWLLVKAAGGQIDVHHHDMIAFDHNRARWEVSDMPSVMGTRFRILPV